MAVSFLAGLEAVFVDDFKRKLDGFPQDVVLGLVLSSSGEWWLVFPAAGVRALVPACDRFDEFELVREYAADLVGFSGSIVLATESEAAA